MPSFTLGRAGGAAPGTRPAGRPPPPEPGGAARGGSSAARQAGQRRALKPAVLARAWLAACPQLFFAKVLRSANEEDVKRVFSQFGGKVYDVNLFRAFQGAPTTKVSTSAALRTTSPSVVLLLHFCGDRGLGVVDAERRRTGSARVLLRAAQGCGLITMGTHEEALAVIEGLDGRYTWEGMDSPMVVKWMDAALQRRRREQHLANMMQGLGPGGGERGGIGAAVAAGRPGRPTPEGARTPRAPGSLARRLSSAPRSVERSQRPSHNILTRAAPRVLCAARSRATRPLALHPVRRRRWPGRHAGSGHREHGPGPHGTADAAGRAGGAQRSGCERAHAVHLPGRLASSAR